MLRRFVLPAVGLLALVLASCGGDEGELNIRAVGTNSPIRPNSFARVVVNVTQGSICTLEIGEIQRSDVNDAPRSIAPQSPGRNNEIMWRFGVPLEAVEQDFPVTVRCNKNEVEKTATTTIHITPGDVFPAATETPPAASPTP